jgi:hypothetical protein
MAIIILTLMEQIVLLSSELQEQKKEYRLTNKESNAHIVNARGHKLYVPDFITNISFYNFKKKELLYRKSLPVNQCNNSYLQDIINKKYVSWHFCTESYQVGGMNGFTALKMQRFPFLIIDIDNTDISEVAEKIKEWKYFQHCSFFPSISKKGVHVHFRLDLSDIPPVFVVPSRFDAPVFFKKSLRFEILNATAAHLWDSLEEIGIVPDRKVIDRITANPPEISFINEIWASRKPVHYSKFIDIEKRVAKKDPRINNKHAKKIDVFVNRLVELAKRKDAAQNILQWVDGGLSEKRLKGALSFIVDNLEVVKTTMYNNPEVVDLIMSKKTEIGLGIDMSLEKIFGFEGDHHKTYLRAILVYSLSLKKTKSYVPNQLVNVYAYAKRYDGLFDHLWLSKNWHAQSGMTHLSPGKGNTFKYLQVAIPNMLKTMTPENALLEIQKTLDNHAINDKNKRLRDAESYIRRLTQKVPNNV